MKTVISIFSLIVHRVGLVLCAALLTAAMASSRPALGLELGASPFVETEKDGAPVWVSPLGKALGEMLESLAEWVWKAIKDSADSASSPSRRVDPPSQQVTSPQKSSSYPLIVHALRSRLARELSEELKEAIEDDDKESVDRLIADGLDVNWRGHNGATLLHYAATFDCPDVVVLLVRRGALVNAAMANGMTPLDYATSAGKNAVIIVLVEHGGLSGI